MKKMFKRKRIPEKIETRKVPLTSGIAVRFGDTNYIVKSGKRLFKFFSDRCFESWSLPVYDIEKSMVSGYKIAGTIGFREGSLIQNFVDGKMYIVSENKRRLLTNPDTVDLLGLQIFLASDAEIKLHDEGEPLDG